MTKFLPFLLLAAAPAAFAAPVYLETPVTYAPGANVVDKVRDECKIEDMFVREAAPAFAKNNGSGDGTATDAATQTPRVRVQISNVMGVGGGGWTGPKAISIYADLVENGKVTHQTRLTRATTGGAWAGLKGTCTILERSAVALGRDLVKWANDPQHRTPDDARDRREKREEERKAKESKDAGTTE